MIKTICTVSILLLGISISHAATIYVPDNHPTIQDAINASVAGDIIVVRAGTYVENIDFIGKAITVKSEQGASLTTIDGGNPVNPNYGSVVIFQSGEGASSVLEGFTITNGSGTFLIYNYCGGGVFCYGTSPTIRNNTITGNATDEGGGINCAYYSLPTITHNTITQNTASRCGGAVMCSDSSEPTITNNIMSENTTDDGGGIYCYNSSPQIINNSILGNDVPNGDGGGIYCEDYSFPRISNNIISGNVADWGGGIYLDCFQTSFSIIDDNTFAENVAMGCGGGACFDGDAIPVLINNIFWNDFAPTGPEIYVEATSNPTVTYCDVEGGTGQSWFGVGCIDADPLFADPASADYHLTWPSPCRNTGDNAAVAEPTDFEGDPRIAIGTVDMGADEFYFHLYHIGSVLPGSPIDIKVVGAPGLPALLALGTGIQDPPYSTQHGDLWLKMPLAKSWRLGAVPATGILTHTATVPSSWPSGSQHPFQALVVRPWGGGATRLTNLMLLEVE